MRNVRTQNARFPRVGDRCEFFMFVPISAMPERSISKASEKKILSQWWNINTERQTDKLKHAV